MISAINGLIYQASNNTIVLEINLVKNVLTHFCFCEHRNQLLVGIFVESNTGCSRLRRGGGGDRGRLLHAALERGIEQRKNRHGETEADFVRAAQETTLVKKMYFLG